MKYALLAALVSVAIWGASVVLTVPTAPASDQVASLSLTDTPSSTSATTASSTTHIPLPDEVRGIYWTGYTAGTSRGDELLAYATSTGLNTLVIDLKMDNGQLAFMPNDPTMKRYAMSRPTIRDLEGLLKRLHDAGIYCIARIFVMRDGAFGVQHPKTVLRMENGAIWYDKTGTPWLDPAATEVTEYALALGREAYARGFDEIQYDYIRFPTDGHVAAIRYPVYDGTKTKAEVMKVLFERVGGALMKEKIPVSWDLFGMTFWRTDDFDIGQRLADVYPYADAISPMVYPSHYPVGFKGLTNPAMHPYEIVKWSLDHGITTLAESGLTVELVEAQRKFRPWLQDFDIGAEYDAKKIEEQIRASRAAGASGWILWNARNVYTAANYLQ